MSDAAFKTAMYPAYTTAQLQVMAANCTTDARVKMEAELVRRRQSGETFSAIARSLGMDASGIRKTVNGHIKRMEKRDARSAV